MFTVPFKLKRDEDYFFENAETIFESTLEFSGARKDLTDQDIVWFMGVYCRDMIQNYDFFTFEEKIYMVVFGEPFARVK